MLAFFLIYFGLSALGLVCITLMPFPYDTKWNALLKEMLDNNPSIKPGEYTVKVNGIEIWASNFPYSYGQVYSFWGEKTGKPSLITRFRLREAVNRVKLDEIRRKANTLATDTASAIPGEVIVVNPETRTIP